MQLKKLGVSPESWKTSKQKLQYESLLVILLIDIELCAMYQVSRIQHVCFSNIHRS
jgi:hypothetical protein